MTHYTMPYKYGKRTREFLGAFLIPFQSSLPRFWGVFNKTIIPLALVGYEMIRANEALGASLAFYISYSTRARGIIVKYRGRETLAHPVVILEREASHKWRP